MTLKEIIRNHLTLTMEHPLIITLNSGDRLILKDLCFYDGWIEGKEKYNGDSVIININSIETIIRGVKGNEEY